MQDLKMEIRKNNFQNGKFVLTAVKIDILENRQQFRLSLRKEKLEDLFMSKRQQFLNSYSNLEIDPEKLTLQKHITEHIPKDLDDAMNQLHTLLTSSNIEEVKYGINKTRKYTLVNNEKGDFLIRYGLIDIFINFLEKSNENDILVKILI